MRALITGTGGFAGQHLARRLLENPQTSVFGVARSGVSWTGDDPCASERFTLLLADLARATDARQIIQDSAPDQLYLLAAFSAPAEAFVDPMATIVNNVACVLNVLEAARYLAPKARILVVSSAEVYGRSPASGESVDEHAPLAPDNPYAVSKAAQDLLGYQYHVAYGMDIVRVRPFNHIGPGQSDRFMAPSFARQIAEVEAGLREPVIEVGNLDAWRDFTDVRDMVRAYELALSGGAAAEPYNLATGKAVAVRSVLKGLLGLSRRRISIQLDAQRVRPVDARVLVGNPGRFMRQTGWEPLIPLEQTLADILDDWRDRVRAR